MELTNQYIQSVNISLTKISMIPMVNEFTKLRYYNYLKALRAEEKEFIKRKDNLIEKLSKKDEKGNKITAVNKHPETGEESLIYVFKNHEQWEKEINLLLNEKVKTELETFELNYKNIMKIPLFTVNDISVLEEFGIIKELVTDARTKN